MAVPINTYACRSNIRIYLLLTTPSTMGLMFQCSCLLRMFYFWYEKWNWMQQKKGKWRHKLKSKINTDLWNWKPISWTNSVIFAYLTIFSVLVCWLHSRTSQNVLSNCRNTEKVSLPNFHLNVFLPSFERGLKTLETSKNKN
jgi:hypothetical protein